MAKMQQFDLEVKSRVDKDSDPPVGDPFTINIPPFIDEDDDDHVIVDGRPVTFKPPRLSRFLMLSVSYETGEKIWEITSGATALVFSCLNSEDKSYLRRRFNDEDDPFDLGAMADIVQIMMETWSARPTKRASGSSSSRGKRGSASTPKQPSQEETSSEN